MSGPVAMKSYGKQPKAASRRLREGSKEPRRSLRLNLSGAVKFEHLEFGFAETGLAGAGGFESAHLDLQMKRSKEFSRDFDESRHQRLSLRRQIDSAMQRFESFSIGAGWCQALSDCSVRSI